MSNKNDTKCCPLCRGESAETFYEDNARTYLRCPSCRLVFVPADDWVAVEEERRIYDLHQNDPDDPGYRRFLSRLSEPLCARLAPGQTGLDFGCGPGPAMKALLEEKGHRVDLYDPYYYNDPEVFRRRYDFICATEVVEHLRDPGSEFDTLFKLLKPGGWLGIMTKLVIDKDAFSRWHYIRDLTHIAFYSQDTFAFIARRFQTRLALVGKDVVLLQKT